jgi:hypothetical protein
MSPMTSDNRRKTLMLMTKPTCFGQNRDKISNRCLTVLASYGLQ